MTSLHSQLRDSYAELQGKQKSAASRAASIGVFNVCCCHLPAGQCALDLGAGQGELVEALQRGYASVEGIELSPSQVRLAELHGCQAVRR